MKRGQITIFIIVGIIIVAAVILGLYFKKQVVDSYTQSQAIAKAGLSEDAAEVWDEVFGCAQRTTEEAILLLAAQGGYILPPEGSLELEDSLIAYAFKEGKKTAPTSDSAVEEIKIYVEAMLPLCPDFENYPKLTITETEPKVQSITLSDDTLSLNIDYLLAIDQSGEITKIDKPFPIQINTKLKGLIEAEGKIADELAKDPSQIAFNTLSSISQPVDVTIYDSKTAIFKITDLTTTIQGYELSYFFASEVEQ